MAQIALSGDHLAAQDHAQWPIRGHENKTSWTFAILSNGLFSAGPLLRAVEGP